MDAMAAIRVTFFQECQEQLAALEADLLALNEGSTDSETVNSVFRAVHSIKGGAGAFKLESLVKFAHKFETTLDHVRGGKLAPSPDVMKVLLRSADVLADLVELSRDGNAIDDDCWLPTGEELSALSVAIDAPEDDEEFSSIDFQPALIDIGGNDVFNAPNPANDAVFLIEFSADAELYDRANETLLIFRELQRLGNVVVACDTTRLPLLDALDPQAGYLTWNLQLTTAEPRQSVDDVFEFVNGDCHLLIKTEAPATPTEDAYDIAALLRSVQDNNDEAAAMPFSEPLQVATDAVPLSTSIGLARADNPVTAPTTDDAANGTSRAKASANQAPATIRVEFDRVDRLINLVGELVINQAMLSQRVLEADFEGSSAVLLGLEELEQLTREIQESVMAIRAQPVKPLFQRMSRIVREIADVTQKDVKLKTEGDATEVDKTVVERLADPLTHMIRNAVDHGLESPAVRLAAGKPAEGVVKLSAAHRSGRIVIEVSDDGAGINRPKVRAAAIRKGLIPADAILSDNEIDNLLFLPGFSTADTVSNISGRGVGMDVVKRSIQALGGRISISSRPGYGSTFSMSLPLTLAVLDGMVVSVGGETIVVPLTAIVETLRPKSSELHGLGVDGRVIAIRNTFIPLIDVGCELGISDRPIAPETGVTILVEAEGGARSALVVDAIQDQRQVVIKSLEENYGGVSGIAAATILGDGRVALILDVDAVVRRTRGDLTMYAMEKVAALGSA